MFEYYVNVQTTASHSIIHCCYGVFPEVNASVLSCHTYNVSCQTFKDTCWLNQSPYVSCITLFAWPQQENVNMFTRYGKQEVNGMWMQHMNSVFSSMWKDLSVEFIGWAPQMNHHMLFFCSFFPVLYLFQPSVFSPFLSLPYCSTASNVPDMCHNLPSNKCTCPSNCFTSEDIKSIRSLSRIWGSRPL